MAYGIKYDAISFHCLLPCHNPEGDRVIVVVKHVCTFMLNHRHPIQIDVKLFPVALSFFIEMSSAGRVCF